MVEVRGFDGPTLRPTSLALFSKKWEIGRCERIRTSDPFVPNEVRYQPAPHTDILKGEQLYQRECVSKPRHCGQIANSEH